jgi:hypothetical protein
MQEHVRMEHTEDEKQIYSRAGGFWVTLIGHFHQTGRWPMGSDVFLKANQDRVRVQIAPLARKGADAPWREGEHRPGKKISASTAYAPVHHLNLFSDDSEQRAARNLREKRPHRQRE